MEPLRVIAKMSEPVVYYGDGMHLDGILSFGAFMSLSPDERRKLPPIGDRWAVDFDLPLQKWKIVGTTPEHIDDRLFDGDVEVCEGEKTGVLWGWKASAVSTEWLCDGRYAIRRRTEIEQMVRYTRSPSVNIGAGQQKATDIAFPAKFAPELYWYAVGDLEEVRKLLPRVSNIGKITTKGPGKVTEWIVEPWENDWSVEREGVLTRNMPATMDALGFYAEASIRPPYHHFSRIVPALRPYMEGMSNANL